MAEELGIGTAVAFPVLLGDKVAAVLEFFSDRVIQPDSRIADAMVGVGLQLGRVIERAEFEEHLLTIAEEIQRGISQDLHDDVGQELTGLGLKAQTLAEMLAPATTPSGKLAADIAASVDRTHDKVRGLSRGMLPIELEEGLLAGALEQLAAATSGSSRIRCGFTCPHPDPVFDSRVSVHLYRIAQEAVTNALRHSGAQEHPDHAGSGRRRDRLENRRRWHGTFDQARRGQRHGPADHALSRRTDRWEAGGWPRPARRDAGRMPVGHAPPPKMRNSKSNRRRS